MLKTEDSLQSEFLHLLSPDILSPLFSSSIFQVEESIFAKEEEEKEVIKTQITIEKKIKKQKVEETIKKEEINRNWILSIRKKRT